MESTPLLRILIVDDEHLIADTLAMIIKARGYHAWAAYSAEEATLVVEEFRPDAVISDVVMPGMNGIDLANWLGANHPQCKVLLISGNVATAGMLEESARHGHLHTILPKPVHPEQILQFVATCAAAA